MEKYYSGNALSVIGFQDMSILVKGRFGKCPFGETLSVICSGISEISSKTCDNSEFTSVLPAFLLTFPSLDRSKLFENRYSKLIPLIFWYIFFYSKVLPPLRALIRMKSQYLQTRVASSSALFSEQNALMHFIIQVIYS